MIQPTRVHPLNEHPIRKGNYVLYWMQASQRTIFNHALEYAIRRANELKLPLVVGFGLTDNYPEANARHYFFMLEGLRDVQQALRRRGIQFWVRLGNLPDVPIAMARHAAIVICDCGYLRHQRRWRQQLADELKKPVIEVETDVVVPVDVASDKHEFAARTLRPKIHRALPEYLYTLRETRSRHPSLKLKLPGGLDVSDPRKLLAKLRADRSVPPSTRLTGGQSAAQKLLRNFVSRGLHGYAGARNEPSKPATSTLSPYLHFGQISPLEIALAVRNSDAPEPDKSAFLEELIVRRELSINFVHFDPRYDEYECLPEWARKTLHTHKSDLRQYNYTREQLEAAQTHDPYWNAAQTEMVRSGFMHNYMRMYWGKKVLEWKKKPREAYDDLLYLNNKYLLCGRDPNAWANVGWIFGLHDRPWGRRPIFGTVRYMNAAGLERKFDIAAYCDWVQNEKWKAPNAG